MRVADPHNTTPALEAFGYKQLAFEPFFRGGLITAAAVPLIAQFGAIPLFAAMMVVLLAALALGLLKFGKMSPAEDPLTSQP